VSSLVAMLPRMVFSRRKTTTELLEFELSAYLSVLTVKSGGLGDEDEDEDESA
jgi:hypothetical protein